MTSFKAELPTELIRQFEELGNSIEDIADKMTEAGANTVLPQVNRNLEKSAASGYETGELRRSIIIKRFKGKNGIGRVITFSGTSKERRAAKNGKVYPRKKPQRLNEIAAVLEYGRSGQAPRPFLRTAFIEKEHDIAAAMEEIFDKETRKYRN